MTVVPGCVRHKANAMHPTRYVLPTWRGSDMTQRLEANMPEASFARISRPRSSCHSSKPQPRLLQVSRTLGQPVETAVDGATRCLASSAKRLIGRIGDEDRKSTRLNSSHVEISYAVFCLKKKKRKTPKRTTARTTPH